MCQLLHEFSLQPPFITRCELILLLTRSMITPIRRQITYPLSFVKARSLSSWGSMVYGQEPKKKRRLERLGQA